MMNTWQVYFIFLILSRGYCFFVPKMRTPPLPAEVDDRGVLYLTPLLDAGKYNEAQQQSKVVPNIGNTTSYSGFFTVNKECGSNLFFWFFPAQNDWNEAPTVLWLQGGPGESSMFGMLEEIGPFSADEQGLKHRKYSWNVKNNLLFIDQPVGTGYSFTKSGCYPGNETAISKDLYSAVVQFHKLFPNLKKNKFFISGESYAGHFIPALGYAIHKNNPTAEIKVDLAGMLIGNGWSDPIRQVDYSTHLYQLGILDTSGRDVLHKFEQTFVQQVTSENWEGANHTFYILVDHLNNTGVDFYNFLRESADMNYVENGYWKTFMQIKDTKLAIHVGSLQFLDVMLNGHHHNFDQVQSVKPLIEDLLQHYNIVFYNGQLDIACAYPMTIKMLRSLKWSGEQQYLSAPRHKWYVEGKLAGYYKGVNHLHDVLVRNAGHMVPHDQPKWAYYLINHVTHANTSNILQGFNDDFNA